MKTFWRQAGAVARKELDTERRSGEVFLVTAPFGAVALLLIPLAIGVDTPLLSRIGPGMYFAVVLLFGILVALRQSAADGPAQRDLMNMLAIDPAARFAGQAAVTALLLVGFELVLAPVAGALYDPDVPGWWWLLVVLPLLGIGLGLLGTMVSWLTGGAGRAAALAPLLVAPLAVPLLLGATQALEGLQLGEDILGWLLLLVAIDLILAAAGILSARPLQEASA